MALLDNLPNIFATQEPDYLKGLLGDKYPALQNQSTKSGLINAALTYLTLPKNQNVGTANILARTYLGGMQGAQGVYDTKAKNVVDALNVAKTTKQIEMEGMTELDKLIYNRSKLAEADPKSPYLSAYDQAISQKGGLYGTSVEGVSYNTLLRGNNGSADAEAFRKTPAYAVAYRDSFAAKTVMQTVQDPVTGVTKQVPVQIQPAAPPPNILPPIYGSGGTTKPAATTAPTTTADAGANITSAPTALTPTLFKDYSAKIDQGNLFNSSLENLKADIKQNGLQIGSLGATGARQAALYEDSLTKLRIADELGVLNKEDLPRLQKKLPPPDQITTWIKGGGNANALLGAIEAVQQSNNMGIQYYTNKINPSKTIKPTGVGGGLMIDLDAISKELKRRKGG